MTRQDRELTSVKHSVSLIKNQSLHAMKFGSHVIFREIIIESTSYDKSVPDPLKCNSGIGKSEGEGSAELVRAISDLRIEEKIEALKQLLTCGYKNLRISAPELLECASFSSS